jgi:hypothetical protein
MSSIIASGKVVTDVLTYDGVDFDGHSVNVSAVKLGSACRLSLSHLFRGKIRVRLSSFISRSNEQFPLLINTLTSPLLVQYPAVRLLANKSHLFCAQRQQAQAGPAALRASPQCHAQRHGDSTRREVRRVEGGGAADPWRSDAQMSEAWDTQPGRDDLPEAGHERTGRENSKRSDSLLACCVACAH